MTVRFERSRWSSLLVLAGVGMAGCGAVVSSGHHASAPQRASHSTTTPVVTPTPSASSSAAPPDIAGIELSFVPSPDGSLPTGVVVSVEGSRLGDTPNADSFTVARANGQDLASAILGGATSGGTLRQWSDQHIVFSVPYTSSAEAEAFSSAGVNVTVTTRHGSVAEEVSLPTSPLWRPWLVWGASMPAVAAEYFALGSAEPDLTALNGQAQQGQFPASAQVAEAAVPGGRPDPVRVWPVVDAKGYWLIQPTDLVGGVVPAGDYLIYEGRFFGDPLAGHFSWLVVGEPVGTPSAFESAAHLEVLAGCSAPAGHVC
ncbi:hypothetical protein Afer_1340 [Acidimicrobium ferrooxidans DSM 10331]|uniref:Uncharacterized protein n=1 Tax=Acidimicrobium ferrooxidans (strain DSM 10331 / JCM 15462 / NBRC 103882 / ICP) TaxID=525909 RepID=C7LZV8_ACIFD|nr:hypothetical protein [Acidimicrobium ferrooxidans]ACU54266.1 hypothetical protein Afer_1340 [Acidimicrobium ferrooxidans DSM 10331]